MKPHTIQGGSAAKQVWSKVYLSQNRSVVPIITSGLNMSQWAVGERSRVHNTIITFTRTIQGKAVNYMVHNEVSAILIYTAPSTGPPRMQEGGA